MSAFPITLGVKFNWKDCDSEPKYQMTNPKVFSDLYNPNNDKSISSQYH